MSRSGYSDDYGDYDPWRMVMWRGTIVRATRGKRGQQFFRDLVAALDAMPAKRLIANALGTEQPEGDVCTLGCLARRKGAELSEDDAYDHEKLGATFDIAAPLAQETMWINDEAGPRRGETPEQRWERVRKWAESQIRQPAATPVPESP